MKVVKQVPLYRQIYIQLRDAIFNGEMHLESNQIINEVQLATELEVSRGPVREAVRQLENEGLLVRDGSALRVYAPTLADLKNLYQCRMVIEPACVKLACEHIGQKQLEELDAILCRTRELMHTDKGKTYKELAQISEDFHGIINKCSGNPRLTEQISRLESILHFYRIANTAGDASWRERIYQEHGTILRLIKEKDADGVETYVKGHIERDLEHLVTTWKWPM